MILEELQPSVKSLFSVSCDLNAALKDFIYVGFKNDNTVCAVCLVCEEHLNSAGTR